MIRESRHPRSGGRDSHRRCGSECEFAMSYSLQKCRLCLRLGRFGSIFEEDDSVRFSEMVMAITDILIDEGDGLPLHVCSQCVESLSAAYVFRMQCLRSDLHLRTHSAADTKDKDGKLNSSFSGLLNQEFHVNSRLDCSVLEYDDNVAENYFNKDVEFGQPSKPESGQTSESEVEANSMTCDYCHEPLCNIEKTHDCGAASSKHSSASDETVIVADKVQPLKHGPKGNVRFGKGDIKCLLCDEHHTSYDDYVSHLFDCTANVRIQFYECSACHDVKTSMKEYLQHIKSHFRTAVVTQSIDCVDSTRRENELMQTLAPPKPMRGGYGWSTEFLYREQHKPKSLQSKEVKFPKVVKTFLGLDGSDGYSKNSSPAKESIRKFIQAGREKTANYHCFGRGGKKLKKKSPKYRVIQARKNVERKLFASTDDIKPDIDNSNTSKYFDALNHTLNESFSTISESSTDFATIDEPIYAVVEKKKIFMLSDFLKDREHQIRMLSSLGAEVACNTSMEMRATHFVSVLPRDTCSGMMVCALATGKWLLHHTYVADSYAQGRLLNESEYSWARQPRLALLNTTSQEAARASEFWRNKLRAPLKTYPFQGARVVLIMERKYAKYYRFVFKTLKAKVLFYDQKDTDACRGATHCFVDMKSVRTSDLVFFADRGVPVYPYQYILIYLLKCGDVTDQHKYLLQDRNTLKNPFVDKLNQTC